MIATLQRMIECAAEVNDFDLVRDLGAVDVMIRANDDDGDMRADKADERPRSAHDEVWEVRGKAAEAELAALREGIAHALSVIERARGSCRRGSPRDADMAQALSVIDRAQQAAHAVATHPALPQEIRDLVAPLADGLADGGAA